MATVIVPLDTKWFASQFRELAVRFKNPIATTQKGIVAESHKRRTDGGQLFIDAVKSGFFTSLPGSAELVERYESPPAPNPKAQTHWVYCPANLFLEIVGKPQIQVRNDGGKFVPVKDLAPGLLPDAIPSFGNPAGYAVAGMVAYEQGIFDEYSDLRLLEENEFIDRQTKACEVLANLLDNESETKSSNVDQSAGDSKTSWRQTEVNAAVQRYIDRHADVLAAARERCPDAIEAAKTIFGRNLITRELGIKSEAMVGKCPVWRAIADELGITRKRSSRKNKIGLGIALEQQAEDAGDTTANNVEKRDIINAIRTAKLASDAPEHEQKKARLEMVNEIEAGRMSLDRANEILEASQLPV